jgi:hypothetical protein
VTSDKAENFIMMKRLMDVDINDHDAEEKLYKAM